MNEVTQDDISRIADALEKIVGQLEIINSPEKDREFNKWYYFWNKRIKSTEDIIEFFKERNKPERVAYYEEELKQLKEETFIDRSNEE
jgi:hypothetical protein